MPPWDGSLGTARLLILLARALDTGTRLCRQQSQNQKSGQKHKTCSRLRQYSPRSQALLFRTQPYPRLRALRP
ncbi:hypothetical protein BJX66DRAFT_150994 [Aspergillus keveii]|uniref:Secreted protein n=1 Tax=Aspergillus keveii TaxID=714993 RepID=A0ABR4GPX9_9EURO